MVSKYSGFCSRLACSRCASGGDVRRGSSHFHYWRDSFKKKSFPPFQELNDTTAPSPTSSSLSCRLCSGLSVCFPVPVSLACSTSVFSLFAAFLYVSVSLFHYVLLLFRFISIVGHSFIRGVRVFETQGDAAAARGPQDGNEAGLRRGQRPLAPLQGPRS